MKKGFTLIELLVVVLIIGILSAIALPQYQKAVIKSRYTQLKVFAHAIAKAQEIYYMVNNSYSPSFSNLDIDIGGTPATTEDMNRTFLWGYCSNSTNAYAAVTCYNNTIKMGYQVYYAHSPQNPSDRFCYSAGNELSTIQQQLCKAESQETTPSGGTTEQPFWRYQ